MNEALVEVFRYDAWANGELFRACRSLSDEQLDIRYPKRFFLVHAIAHSAEHRTEVKVALAHIGVETPDLDGWFYAEFAGYGWVGG